MLFVFHGESLGCLWIVPRSIDNDEDLHLYDHTYWETSLHDLSLPLARRVLHIDQMTCHLLNYFLSLMDSLTLRLSGSSVLPA